MREEQFLIHELARRAGTTVRTIRYYTDEGLLPQPLNQGKYAYYTDFHLKRLDLIRRMKAAYLPLREIREILNSLDDAEVEKRLAEPQITYNLPIPDGSQPGSGANALDYISKLFAEQSGHRSDETLNSPRSLPPVNTPPSLQPAKKALVFPIQNYFIEQPSPSPATEQWRRVTLAPGVELHLREPASPNTSRLTQELLNFAQKLFSSKKEGK